MTRFAFVTGANKGIGYEIVRQLAEKNYHVFLGSRNEELGQKAVQSLGFSNVSFVQVDISDTQSIKNSRVDWSMTGEDTLPQLYFIHY
jgi:short-subunit dehydrogenase